MVVIILLLLLLLLFFGGCMTPAEMLMYVCTVCPACNVTRDDSAINIRPVALASTFHVSGATDATAVDVADADDIDGDDGLVGVLASLGLLAP